MLQKKETLLEENKIEENSSSPEEKKSLSTPKFLFKPNPKPS